MEIETKDGIILRNIPDGTPDEAIKARIEQIRAGNAKPPEPPKPVPSGGLLNIFGPNEYALHLGSSMIAKPVSEVAGLAAMMQNYLTGKRDDVKGFQQDVQRRMTYEPRTEVGKAITESPLNPINAVGNVVNNVANWQHGIHGGGAEDSSLRGMAANAIREASIQAPGFIGMKMATPIADAPGTVANMVTSTRPVAYVGNIAKNLFDSESGVAGRLYNRVAEHGRPGGAQAVIQALETARSRVPGERLTAGEAAALAARNPEFSALQEIVASTMPNKYDAITGANESARRSAVGTIAKTESSLADAIRQRSEAARANYGQAAPEIISVDSGLSELMSRPSMESVMRRAADLAKEKGDVFITSKAEPATVVSGKIVSESGAPLIQKTIPATPATYPVQSLHYMKMAMDDILKNPERFGIGAAEAKAIGETQKAFVELVGKKSPAYDFARQTFREQSGPINRMEVGQQLERSLTDSLGSKERGTVFANAVNNAPQTIKKATGNPRYDRLEQILTQREMGTVESVMDSLKREAVHTELASAGREAAGKAIGVTFPHLPGPGLFNPAISGGRAILNRMSGLATDKLIRFMAENMDNPAAVAKMMRDATPQQKAVIDSIMKQRMVQGAGITAPYSQQGER